MPEQNDIERLLALDALIIKAGGMGTEAVFLNLERRVYQVLSTAWRARARTALDKAMAVYHAERSGGAVGQALHRGMNRWPDHLQTAIKTATRNSYLEAKRQMLQRSHGLIPPLAPIGGAIVKPVQKGPKEVSIQPSFTQRDDEAVDRLAKGQLHWINDFYDDDLSDEIDTIISETMLQGGLGRADAGKLLEERLAAKLGIGPEVLPQGWASRSGQYFQLIAANTVTNGRVRGSLGQMAQIGVTKYTIAAVGDERTCSRCLALDGKVNLVEHAIALMDRLDGAESPEEVKAIHPWAKSVEDIERNPGNFIMPPFHGRCRCTVDVSEDSEISFEPMEGW